MGLSEKLTQIKSETESLLAYANGVTGEEDISLGDAILTLGEGFGGSSSDSLFELIAESEVEFTEQNETSTANQYNVYAPVMLDIWDLVGKKTTPILVVFELLENKDSEGKIPVYMTKSMNLTHMANAITFGSVAEQHKSSNGTITIGTQFVLRTTPITTDGYIQVLQRYVLNLGVVKGTYKLSVYKNKVLS